MTRIPPTEEERAQLKVLQASMKEIYDSFNPFVCHIISSEEKIYFNARGWYHLQHDIHGKLRDVKPRIHKLLLVPLVIVALKNAKQIDEHREEMVKLKRKKRAKSELVDYWAVSAYVGKKGNVKVKVVVIKPKNAEKMIFWSVMRLGTKKAPDGELL